MDREAPAAVARALRDARLTPVLLAPWQANYSIFGARKQWVATRRAGHDVGRDKVARLMRQLRIRGLKRTKWVRATRPDLKVARPIELAGRVFAPDAPNRPWVADLTHVATWSGVAHVCRHRRVQPPRRWLAGRVEHAHPNGPRGLGDGLLGARYPPQRAPRTPTPAPRADSTGRCNTSCWGWFVAESRYRRQMAVREFRGKVWSPSRPSSARREDRVRFWEAIAGGASSEEAAGPAGVSEAVGSRWFRQAGGMAPLRLAPVSGRYLSFEKREEIAVLRSQGCGIREIARRLGRPPSTVSRELRRNASTRSSELAYRASTAQWRAEQRASRPKPSKLAADDRLQGYVATV